MIGAEHDLVARLQQAFADAITVDHAAIAGAQVAQHDAIAVGFQPDMLLGDSRLHDMDIGSGLAADRAWLIQRETTPMVDATDATQDSVARSRRAGGRVNRQRLGMAPQQGQLDTIHVHRIASAQHRHATHRAPIDVQTLRALTQLQPDAAAVNTKLDRRLLGLINQARLSVRATPNGMHALAQHQVVTVTVWELQSEGIHAAAI